MRQHDHTQVELPAQVSQPKPDQENGWQEQPVQLQHCPEPRNRHSRSDPTQGTLPAILQQVAKAHLHPQRGSDEGCKDQNDPATRAVMDKQADIASASKRRKHTAKHPGEQPETSSSKQTGQHVLADFGKSACRRAH